MEENLSSPEDLESDFDDERSAESELGDSDGEGPGMLEVPSRLSFTRSCSQYSSSSVEEEASAATKVRRRRRRKRRGLGGVSGSSQSQKTEMIEEAVRAGDRDRLSQLAVSEGGLLSDEMRLLAWPRLLGINLIETVTILPGDAEISQHGEFNQVVLDVNRSLKRFPPGIEEAERPALQEQLTRLIVRVLIAQPGLHYYQGYHDVAITFLLVVGEHLGYQIMERLSVSHLRKFMAPSMEQTMELLQLIYPIIKKTSPDLHSHLVASELGTVFALPWLITWFGHVLPNYCDVVRLYDFFLAGPPLMPIYLAAAIVLHREEEILSTDCEMSAVHGLLSRIPVNLPFETLLVDCQSLYERFPPFTIQAEAERELARQREERERQIAGRRKPSNGGAGSYRQLLTRIVIFSAPVVIGVLIWRASQS